jgi:hypothetical protein
MPRIGCLDFFNILEHVCFSIVFVVLFVVVFVCAFYF